MSYWDADDAETVDHYNQSGVWSYDAPLLHDIAAVQAAYGADMTTRIGNTIYGFNSNAGRAVFDFTQNVNPIIAIWDAGGIDTLDGSGYSTAQFIDLNPGSYSSMGYLTDNVAIAFGATIENAVGGSGADKIKSNSVSNVLTGGQGYDTYAFSVAGWGSDLIIDINLAGRIVFTHVSSLSLLTSSFVVSVSGADYILTHQPTGSQISLQGVSSVTAWEFAYTAADFNNATSWTTIDFNGLFANPNSAASVVTVTGGVQLRPMSSNLNPRWITGAELPLLVTDADGDAPVRYRFTDVGTGSGERGAALWRIVPGAGHDAGGCGKRDRDCVSGFRGCCRHRHAAGAGVRRDIVERTGRYHRSDEHDAEPGACDQFRRRWRQCGAVGCGEHHGGDDGGGDGHGRRGAELFDCGWSGPGSVHDQFLDRRLELRCGAGFRAPTIPTATTATSCRCGLRTVVWRTSQTITVTVTNATDVNTAPPVVTSNGGGDDATVSVAENSTAVTTVTATDAESRQRCRAIRLWVERTRAGSRIDSTTGALSFIAAPDYEAPADSDANNSYIVQVRASDGAFFDTQTITVDRHQCGRGPPR